jgi:hypothetical protein
MRRIQPVRVPLAAAITGQAANAIEPALEDAPSWDYRRPYRLHLRRRSVRVPDGRARRAIDQSLQSWLERLKATAEQQ